MNRFASLFHARAADDVVATDAGRLSRLRVDHAWQQWLLLAVGFATALVMRKVLIPDFTGDFTYYMLPWFEFLKSHGFAGLGQEFANYNPPYLYLLYIGTLTGFDALHTVKIISGFFDVVLAVGVAAIIHHFRRSWIVAGLIGVLVLFVPEVFLNSGMWGQVDSIYTSFLVWTAYFLVTRREGLAWIFFALAFAFKLQALFFLPWLLVAFIVYRQRWMAVVLGVAAFLLAYVPSLIAGRSIQSLASVYFKQVESNHELTMFSPNLYQWVPNQFFDTVQPAGICLALGTVALLSLLFLRRSAIVARSTLWLLQVGAAYAAVVPFVLPQMHDRYFYTAGVLAVVCAFLDRRYIVPAVILQFTAVMAYTWVLFQTQPALALPIAAILQLGAVGWIVWLALTGPRATGQTFFPAERGIGRRAA
ncbi:hypothetical protein [Glaciihabitans sp. dw_435]|uniref:hypothetical protein n=1 Tax=Glaciihabitans sp. dw_435 TaxID=2720081 RepID=UPI001BD3D2D6|nr:hypothetical protein [Glaciihabitans sp. dw_435]